MNTYTIYKATNTINQKIYIGFDSSWPTRQQQHLIESAGPNPDDGSIFHKAIRKYGSDAFTWEVLCQSRDGEHLLNEMEGYFIRLYNSHYLDGHGYNMTYGGEGALGRVQTEETRKKISKAAKGRKHSKETLEKMSASLRGVPKSPESNKKRSESLMGHTTSKKTRKKISKKLKGTTKFYNPHTNECRQCVPGTEPDGFIRGGPKLTQETKEKLRVYRTGKTHTEKSKRKMSRIKTGAQNSMYNKTHTAEARKAIGENTKRCLTGTCWYHHPATRKHYRGMVGTEPEGYVKGRVKRK